MASIFGVRLGRQSFFCSTGRAFRPSSWLRSHLTAAQNGLQKDGVR
jgi:hypothetical protein